MSRIGFLSSETVELMRHYLRVRRYQHEYIFDGRLNVKGGHSQPLDQPLSQVTTWQNVNRAFKRLQMNQQFDGVHYYYHPHVFRTLCLALLKSGGYPADWAEHLVGHSIGTQAAYLPPVELLAKEWLKLDEQFCFLTDPSAGAGLENVAIQTQPGKVETANVREDTTDSIPKRKDGLPSLAHSPQSHRWSSNSWFYVKTTLDSTDYDQALAEGFVIYDREGSLRVLRKRVSHLTPS